MRFPPIDSEFNRLVWEMTLWLTAIIVLAMTLACGSALPLPPQYRVQPALVTPMGHSVDPSSYTLPPWYVAEVDRVVSEVEDCVGVHAPVTIKIADDWMMNCDATEQVLPVVAGAGDPNKKDNYGLPCPYAHWRAILQSDDTIVTTPNLRAVKIPIAQLLTGDGQIQSPCTQSSTSALLVP